MHVEVALKSNYLTPSILYPAVQAWIGDYSSKCSLTVGILQAESYSGTPLEGAVESVALEGFEEAPDGTLNFWEDNNINVSIHLFHLSDDPPEADSVDCPGSSPSQPTHTLTSLPSAELHPLWPSLHMGLGSASTKSKVLNYILQTFTLSALKVRPEVVALNRVILLSGPPGTGKTTLCRAVAQKATIRMGRQALLINLHTHSLFSKYFSESGQKISSLFTHITSLCASAPLVVLLIDEVESLVPPRSSADLSDGVRATNAVLTCLDDMRRLDNVVVLCTTNVAGSGGIDEAFMSRVDLRVEVGPPDAEAVEGMVEEVCDELERVGVLGRRGEGWKALVEAAAGRGVGKSGRAIRKVAVERWAEVGGGMGVEWEVFLGGLWT